MWELGFQLLLQIDRGCLTKCPLALQTTLVFLFV